MYTFLPESELVMILWFSLVSVCFLVFISITLMTSVQFEWGDNFRVKPNELVYLLIEGTKIEDSYLTLMRNCILGGDNFRAFRVDLGGQNSKGDNFQLYLIIWDWNVEIVSLEKNSLECIKKYCTKCTIHMLFFC